MAVFMFHIENTKFLSQLITALLVFIGITSCALALAQENSQSITTDNIIYWQTDHRPPASIMRGANKGQGYIDGIREYLISNMPHYQHKYSTSSLDKLFEDMKKGKNVCHPLLFVTEARKELAYFSIAATITPSIRIAIKSNLAQSLQLKEPVNLEQLITESRATFAIIKGRSYGPYIDEFLQRQKALDTHVQISVEDNTTLFKLLERDRIDFTFAYPFELTFYQTQEFSKNTPFKILSIDGVEDYTLGSVACTKNAWGRSVIERVNVVLSQQRQQQNFIEIINRWWPEESNKAAFQNFYKDVFLNN